MICLSRVVVGGVVSSVDGVSSWLTMASPCGRGPFGSAGARGPALAKDGPVLCREIVYCSGPEIGEAFITNMLHYSHYVSSVQPEVIKCKYN